MRGELIVKKGKVCDVAPCYKCKYKNELTDKVFEIIINENSLSPEMIEKIVCALGASGC